MVIPTSNTKLKYVRTIVHCAAILIMPLAVFTSCERPENPAAGKSPVRIDVDWSGCGKNMPTGMTIIFHHHETGEKTQAIDNNVSFATPYLSPGRHWATVFNLTEDEFANIRFRGLESAETAGAYAKEAERSGWYPNPSDGDSYIAGQPEWLAVDTLLTDAVKPLPAGMQTGTEVIGTLHPRSIIYTLHLTVHIGNISNLSAARGAISGLAAGRRLAGNCPDDNTVTVTHLIESGSWTCSRTTESSDMGLVKADIRCFGLPSNHKGVPDENRFEFHALLADGKTVKRYDMPVGHLFEKAGFASDSRSDNLDLYLELWPEPALPPYSGNGGIDVWFSDWDEYVDFNMPI